MKWINHKVITLSFVFLITEDIVAAIAATLGSTFPDYIEGYHKGQIPKYHRTLSHWFIFYTLIIILFFSLSKGNISFKELTLFKEFNLFKLNLSLITPYIYPLAFWYFFGAFLHVIQDSITGKVPLLNPFSKDFSLKIFDTGSVYEYLLSLLLLIIFIYKFLWPLIKL